MKIENEIEWNDPIFYEIINVIFTYCGFKYSQGKIGLGYLSMTRGEQYVCCRPVESNRHGRGRNPYAATQNLK